MDAPHQGPDPHAAEAGFGFVLHCTEPADVVWQRLWDLDRHTTAIPLTRVATDDGAPLAAGRRFTGRTALGPLGFDDDMLVQQWDPPWHAGIEKVGRVLRGRIEVSITPQDAGCLLAWRQTFGAVGVPNVLARMAAPLLRRGYRHTVQRILRAS